MGQSEMVRTALARARAYDLFGRLIIEGVTAETERWIHFLPAVSSFLPMSPIEYSRVIKEVPPFGSRFLFPATVRERSLEQLTKLIGGVEGEPIYPKTDRDHLGVALGYLARLANLEAAALQSDEDPTPFVDAGVRFLDSYLLRWLPVYAVSVMNKGSRFMEGYGQAVLSLARSHRFSCNGHPVKVAPQVVVPAPSVYSQVGVFVAQPCRSGFFLSAGEVAQLRAMMGLPTDYGIRPHLIDGLYTDAEKAGKRVEVLKETVIYMRTFDKNLSKTIGLGLDISVWRKRIAATIAALESLAEVR